MFPLFTTSCLHVRHDVRDPSGVSGNRGRECCPVILPNLTSSTPFRDLLHAANLRHGTDGFTSPLKEGVLRIFLPLKIRRLRPGLNPRTWVLKASTLPLDHRPCIYTTTNLCEMKAFFNYLPSVQKHWSPSCIYSSLFLTAEGTEQDRMWAWHHVC